MPTIAVDFDGVIHRYSRGWQNGTIYDPPLPGAIEGLHALMQDHAVFIHTSRDAESVAAWLAHQGFSTIVEADVQIEFWNAQGILLVTDRKLPAVTYIDDRAIRFQSWKQVLAELANIENPNPNAPTYEALLLALERVHALHRRNEHTGDCEHCSQRDYPDYAVPWPCPTIQALNG
ncbi:hypothetical protein G6W51_17120 [Streptomyces coelicolor]|nr:hypothetical protein [Streptomyces coelicolor]